MVQGRKTKHDVFGGFVEWRECRILRPLKLLSSVVVAACSNSNSPNLEQRRLAVEVDFRMFSLLFSNVSG